MDLDVNFKTDFDLKKLHFYHLGQSATVKEDSTSRLSSVTAHNGSFAHSVDPNSSTDSSNSNIQNTKTFIKSYKENFSIHGLAKIFEGAFFERIFWFIILASSLGFVAYKSNEFYTEYTKYDVRTEVRIKSDDNITLPALTICKSYRLFGKDVKGFVNDVECYKNKVLNDYTENEYKNCTNPARDAKVTPLKMVTTLRFPHFQYHPHFPSCSTINPNGTITSQSNMSKNHFLIRWPKKENQIMVLYLYLHDQNDLPFSTGDLYGEELIIIEPGYYQISITDKRVIRRMPHPFPSNCTDGRNGESIFPGPYTFKKCQDTCLFRKMLRNCGTVLDHWQKYAGEKSPTNQTSRDTRICLKSELESLKRDCHCRFSCNETAFDVGFRMSNQDILLYYADIQMVYHKNTFTMIQEYEAYPKDKFLTDIGGWCGLFSGMSILSIVEILVFAVLSAVALFEKLRG